MADEKEEFPGLNPQMGAGRRRLLTTLVAAGGTMAALKVLPREWAKPVVEMIELPVHAQGSVEMLLLSNLRFVGAPIPTPPEKDARAQVTAAFDYEDPAGGVTDSASLYANVSPCGEMIFDGNALSSIPGAHRAGTASLGNVSFPFVYNCTLANAALHMSMSVGIRNSNELTGLLPVVPQ
jgi:hypothetical protein